ncbi:MAG: protein translocase SEC61 complex subunit gamma [Candidatus Thermoplasmatota archaeon]|jgi:protein transport protein SEC61 subunit gamma-like protein|nr:protein translocase SEC61 complex subunit gamma [Candidatus Thermoplasmatota archaeon]MDP7264923.1 protein translocase SEC61 complex subunit gamma [Candidatus Thermoplasmatota archaeon]
MDIIEKSLQIQKRIESRTKNLGKGKYGRVLKMARKPNREEYTKTLQITGVGLIIIGAMGFLIFLIWEKLPPLIGDILGL